MLCMQCILLVFLTLDWAYLLEALMHFGTIIYIFFFFTLGAIVNFVIGFTNFLNRRSKTSQTATGEPTVLKLGRTSYYVEKNLQSVLHLKKNYLLSFTSVLLLYNPFSQFVFQLELNSHLQLSLQSDPLLLVFLS